MVHLVLCNECAFLGACQAANGAACVHGVAWRAAARRRGRPPARCAALAPAAQHAARAARAARAAAAALALSTLTHTLLSRLEAAAL